MDRIPSVKNGSRIGKQPAGQEPDSRRALPSVDRLCREVAAQSGDGLPRWALTEGARLAIEAARGRAETGEAIGALVRVALGWARSLAGPARRGS